jgi:hypothetical protein
MQKGQRYGDTVCYPEQEKRRRFETLTHFLTSQDETLFKRIGYHYTRMRYPSYQYQLIFPRWMALLRTGFYLRSLSIELACYAHTFALRYTTSVVAS